MVTKRKAGVHDIIAALKWKVDISDAENPMFNRKNVAALIDAYEALDTAARCYLTGIRQFIKTGDGYPEVEAIEDTLRANDGIEEAEADDEYEQIDVHVGHNRFGPLTGREHSKIFGQPGRCSKCQPVFVKRGGA